jgi:hypothetical protein
VIWCCASLYETAYGAAGDASHPTRQQLIGAWRLVSIDFSGPRGPAVDPFYQADSAGLIIYDASGWMSVQIAAPHRPAWKMPASRAAPDAPHDSHLKAAAFDTYYAYFGSWTYDEATSVVIHSVKSSLIPAETGLDYAQQVSLEGTRLTFTGSEVNHGAPMVRRKVWERLVSNSPPASGVPSAALSSTPAEAPAAAPAEAKSSASALPP